MVRPPARLLPRGPLPFLDVGDSASPTEPWGFVPPSELPPQALDVTFLAFVLEALASVSRSARLLRALRTLGQVFPG